MDKDEVKIIFFLILTGGTVLFYSFRTFKRKRLILDIPTSKIKSAAIGGIVEIIGKVAKINSEKISAPIQNIEATAFIWKLCEKVQRGKRTEWKEINRYYSDEFILIKDQSGGLATVKLRDCDLFSPKFKIFKHFSTRTKSFTKEAIELIEDAFNIEVGRSVSFFSFEKSYRIEEIVIPKNKIVYCLGHSFAPEECPIKIKTKTQPSLYFKAHYENKRFFDNENILISFLSQEKTISKLRMNSIFGLLAGSLSLSVGLFLLIKNLI